MAAETDYAAHVGLSVPLTQAQVESASHVYLNLVQWRLSDSALDKLAASVPDFTAEACLLKTVAINAIYGTQLLATGRMSKHIEEVLGNANPAKAGPELVEVIAKLPPRDGERQRTLVSFGSKFCHFFIDPARFPIYDEAVREALKLHLGSKTYQTDKTKPYLAYCANLERLREGASLHCGTKELDRYLWLTGMFMRWVKERSKGSARVNAELKHVFESPSPVFAVELSAMLPEKLVTQLPAVAA